MSTYVTVKNPGAAQRFVLHDVGWDGYQALLKVVRDRPIRVTYDRGDLELMSPLPIHERYKKLIGRMVEAITEELDIPMIAVGSMTFHRQDLDRGLEPDECYYLASAARIQDPNQINLDVDPPPDLAIEIDITSSSLNRLGIYAALGIPEVWRFDGKSLSVLRLEENGTYTQTETSAAFPFLPMDEMARFLREHHSSNDTPWFRAFRNWVRNEIAPGFRGEGEAIEST